MNVTVSTTGKPSSIHYGRGFIGDVYSGTFSIVDDVRFRFRLLTPTIPGIDWGDGVQQPGGTLQLQSNGPPRTFSGTFTHTYPAPGEYTVTVGSFGLLGYPDSPGYDNPQLPALTGTVLYATHVERFFLFDFGVIFSSGTNSFEFDEPAAYGIVNRAQAQAGPAPPAEIPTASAWALGLLAGTLVVVGVRALRQRV